MRSKLIRSITVTLIGALLAACGGGNSRDTRERTASVTGDWSIEEQIDNRACGTQSGVDEYTISVVQDGSDITVVSPSGVFHGEINGSTIGWRGQYEDNGGWVTITNMRLRVGETNLEGTASWEFRESVDGPLVCSGTTRVAGELVTITLAAPTNLTATALDDGRISLRWTDNSDFEQLYEIERSLPPDRGFESIVSLVPDTEVFTDSGLAAATTYHYRVLARRATGNSDYTNVASARSTAGTAQPETPPATTPTVPAAPVGLIVEASSSTSIYLSWLDEADNETGYRIERSNDSGSSYTAIAVLATDVSDYEDHGLQPESSYLYRVLAHNNAGDSSPVVGSASTPPTPITLPAAPTALERLDADTSSITLGWTDNASNESQYIVERTELESGQFLGIAVLGTNASLYTDSELIPGTIYYYRVLARNAEGSSDYSHVLAASTTQPAPQPPLAPSGLSVSDIESHGLTLNWIDNADDETHYLVQRRLSGVARYVVVANVGANTRTYTNTGLAPATEYFYRVAAVNEAGVSLYSEVVSANTAAPPLQPPAAPATLDAQAVSDTRIQLTWNDDLSTESEYVVLRNVNVSSGGLTMGGSEPTFAEIARLPANSSGYSDTGRAPSTTYLYHVFATNAAGSSAWSPRASATTTAPSPTPPAAPTNFLANAVSSSQIDLSWFDNADNETNYRIERLESGAGAAGVVTDLPADTVSYTYSGLGASTTYSFRVSAVNGAGSTPYAGGSVSASTNAATLAGPSLSGQASGAGSDIDLSWSYSWSGLLASTANGFELQESQVSPSGDFSTVHTTVNNNDRRTQASFTVTGRSPGIYHYRVRAREAAGFTEYSNTVTVQVTAPPQTESVVLEPVDDTIIVLQSNDARQQQIAHPNTFLNVGCDFVNGGFVSDFVCYSSFLRFDTGFLAGRTIRSATLKLFPEVLPATLDDVYRLRPASSAWNDGTLTFDDWNAVGRIYLDHEVVFDLPVTTVVPVELNVTSIVQGWASGSMQSRGFIIDSLSSAGLGSNELRSTVFCSMECSTAQGIRPQLEILYQ